MLGAWRLTFRSGFMKEVLLEPRNRTADCAKHPLSLKLIDRGRVWLVVRFVILNIEDGVITQSLRQLPLFRQML